MTTTQYKLQSGTFRVTKVFNNLPAAHRQWRHPGHCQYIHGHDWTFIISLKGTLVEGMVVDFGDFKPLREQLHHMFDHTMLVCEDDPCMDQFVNGIQNMVNLRVLKSVSAEGLAALVYTMTEEWLVQYGYSDRVQVASVICKEDEKNSAEFRGGENL